MCEEYDGTNWSTGGALNVGRKSGAGTGTQTAALCAGGNPQPGAAGESCEEYDGSSWTAGNDLIINKGGTTGFGSQTDCIVFAGGNPTRQTSTLGYDGTNWSTRPSCATGRDAIGSAAQVSSSAAGFFCAGRTTDGQGTQHTEEFVGRTLTLNTKTITAILFQGL